MPPTMNPWDIEPSADWNAADYWTRYYRDLARDPARHDMVVHRKVSTWIGSLARLGELPCRSPGARRLLDAGCGIALIPHLLAVWGFRVTAVDHCPEAVRAARERRVSEADLARCVDVREPIPGTRGMFEVIVDPQRSLQEVRRFQRPGGAVEFLECDWHDSRLTAGSFDLIYCRNSLRGATAAYWQASLRRFHALLAPGGALLLETVNALGIRADVEAWVAAAGFAPVPADGGRSPAAKYLDAVWPTG